MSETRGGFAARLAAVRERIDVACRACGRDPGAVALLAVSKEQPADAVRAAHAAGLRAFGENRVQELCAKAALLAGLDLSWHLIGSLQTNKVRDLVRVDGLALVHSLDRVRLADALQREWPADRARLGVLLQVHATGEATKHGVPPEEAEALLEHVVRACPALEVRGLMAMGPLGGDPVPVFHRVAALRATLASRSGLALPVLSLGMSGDLEAAIAAGSTLVRIGTALFGPRGT
ncbi:MAG: YggS family pyridoxal phosphate-dependent enzyme [Planctomycetes bacterium]|nr:YggS family pyridoxal phosphate-dependent enzyme [Planctomycetota bacterium]